MRNSCWRGRFFLAILLLFLLLPNLTTFFKICLPEKKAKIKSHVEIAWGNRTGIFWQHQTGSFASSARKAGTLTFYGGVIGLNRWKSGISTNEVQQVYPLQLCQALTSERLGCRNPVLPCFHEDRLSSFWWSEAGGRSVMPELTRLVFVRHMLCSNLQVAGTQWFHVLTNV